MKIVTPSAEVIEDSLSSLSIYQRIDTAASVCYQRPPKPTEEEAIKFCRSMVDRGHLATLEFAVVHLWVNDPHTEYRLSNEKYLRVHRNEDDSYIVTGSIRAFMEADPSNALVQEMADFLSKHYSEFFYSLLLAPNHIRFALPDEIPDSHKHVAVRFIVNRAISHELVRHRPCSFLQESQRYVRYDGEVTFIEPEWADDNGDAAAIWSIGMDDAENRYRVLLRRGLSPQQARSVLPNSTKTELLVYTNLPEWKHIFNLRCSPAADPEMTRVMRPLRDEFARRWPGMFGEE